MAEYRITNRAGELQGTVNTKHGDHKAVREALANMVGGTLATSIRRAFIAPAIKGKFTITPRDAEGHPLRRQGKLVTYIVTLIHDGEDR